jgi:hypothetical protein
MITFSYKSCYIHDNFTDGIVKVQIIGVYTIRVKSVHAAKCYITRYLNGGIKND